MVLCFSQSSLSAKKYTSPKVREKYRINGSDSIETYPVITVSWIHTVPYEPTNILHYKDTHYYISPLIQSFIFSGNGIDKNYQQEPYSIAYKSYEPPKIHSNLW